MELKTKFAPKLKDENCITNLAILIDLTVHLNELNMFLQGEN